MQNRIKYIRKHLGITQMEFAKKINRTCGFISDLETGKCNASPTTLRAICSVFGINEKWLVSGVGNMFVEGREVGEANKENVGFRIKQVRKLVGMTQEQFCKAINYSMMQVSFVELGKTTPSNTFLQKVATVFKVSYDWLLTGTGSMVKDRADDRADKAETDKVDDGLLDSDLIEWLKRNPDVVKELRIRSGLD